MLHVTLGGNPRGRPVLIVHGGPGSGSRVSPNLFDLSRYRAVWIDQRASGQSRPRGSVRRNCTQLLVRDIEAVRQALGIARWIVYGGSWGSALALAYAAAHPDRVDGLLLRSLYLTSAQETNRFFGWSRTKAPQAWRALNKAAGRGLVSKLFQRCATVFQKGTLVRQQQLAVAWNNYERQLLVRKGCRARQLHVKAMRALVFKYRVQAHYLAHRCWLGSHLLGLVVRRLRQVDWPIVAVHGRFDAVCPPKNVFTVRGGLPSLQVHWIPAGHLEGDPLMSQTLRTALDRIRDLSAPSSQGL